MFVHSAWCREKNIPFHFQTAPVSLGSNTIQNLDTSSQLFILQFSVSENECLNISEIILPNFNLFFFFFVIKAWP